MALVGEESEEDLHSDPLFRFPFFDTPVVHHHFVVLLGDLLSHPVAF